jgi:hypothetical protein
MAPWFSKASRSVRSVPAGDLLGEDDEAARGTGAGEGEVVPVPVLEEVDGEAGLPVLPVLPAGGAQARDEEGERAHGTLGAQHVHEVAGEGVRHVQGEVHAALDGADLEVAGVTVVAALQRQGIASPRGPGVVAVERAVVGVAVGDLVPVLVVEGEPGRVVQGALALDGSRPEAVLLPRGAAEPTEPVLLQEVGNAVAAVRHGAPQLAMHVRFRGRAQPLEGGAQEVGALARAAGEGESLGCEGATLGPVGGEHRGHPRDLPLLGGRVVGEAHGVGDDGERGHVAREARGGEAPSLRPHADPLLLEGKNVEAGVGLSPGERAGERLVDVVHPLPFHLPALPPSRCQGEREALGPHPLPLRRVAVGHRLPAAVGEGTKRAGVGQTAPAPSLGATLLRQLPGQLLQGLLQGRAQLGRELRRPKGRAREEDEEEASRLTHGAPRASYVRRARKFRPPRGEAAGRRRTAAPW